MLWLIFSREITVGQFFALWIYSFFLVHAAAGVRQRPEYLSRNRSLAGELRGNPVSSPRYDSHTNRWTIRNSRTSGILRRPFQHRSASVCGLDGVSFKAGRGETIAFVGPSGSGKTTLVKMLVGLYRPKSRRRTVQRKFRTRVRIWMHLRDTDRPGHAGPATLLGSIRDNLLFVRPTRPTKSALRS